MVVVVVVAAAAAVPWWKGIRRREAAGGEGRGRWGGGVTRALVKAAEVRVLLPAR